MSGTMMTATLIHPYVVLFFVNNSASGKLNYIHQMTSKWQRCPDVAFVKRSKEYVKIATPEPFHTYLSARGKLVIEAPIVKCRKAIHALLLYFNLCASVQLNSILCYFTSLSFLTFKNKKKIHNKSDDSDKIIIIKKSLDNTYLQTKSDTGCPDWLTFFCKIRCDFINPTTN
jgi:hypothetical protein